MPLWRVSFFQPFPDPNRVALDTISAVQPKLSPALAPKLAALRAARPWNKQTFAALQSHLKKAPDVALYRINPLAFAADHGLDPDETIDLFIHAAGHGLFRIEWHVVCFGCAKVIGDFRHLREVHTEIYCDICAKDRQADLDDWIEVTFTVHPAVRKIAHHTPARLPLERLVFEHVFCRNIITDDGVVYADRVRNSLHVVRRLAPRKSFRFRMTVQPGILGGTVRPSYRIDGAPGPAHRLAWTVGTNDPTPPAALAPGVVSGEVRNAGRVPALVLIANVTGSRIFRRNTLFTGRHLLNHAAYRKLFAGDDVEGVAGLGVKDVTLLFTDLKGSTALYQRVGDLKAYDLVRRHFDHLGRVVQTNRGAVVKTIGDAVMASFGRPLDAVKAAREMHAAISQFNAEHAEEPLALKIGIHRGSAIVVTQNGRLDYFGQTTNIAARVQGAAGAGEICVTGEIMGDAPSAALLPGARAEEALLRGYDEKTVIYRFR